MNIFKIGLGGLTVGAATAFLIGCAGTSQAQLDQDLATFNAKVTAANEQMIAVSQLLCKNEAGAYQVVQTETQVLTPIAAAVGPQYVAGVGTVQALDTTLVHPTLVALCATINALPVGVVTAAK